MLGTNYELLELLLYAANLQHLENDQSLLRLWFGSHINAHSSQFAMLSDFGVRITVWTCRQSCALYISHNLETELPSQTPRRLCMSHRNKPMAHVQLRPSTVPIAFETPYRLYATRL